MLIGLLSIKAVILNFLKIWIKNKTISILFQGKTFFLFRMLARGKKFLVFYTNLSQFFLFNPKNYKKLVLTFFYLSFWMQNLNVFKSIFLVKLTIIAMRFTKFPLHLLTNLFCFFWKTFLLALINDFGIWKPEYFSSIVFHLDSKRNKVFNSINYFKPHTETEFFF